LLHFDHLLGREFKLGSADCYGFIRDFYRDVFKIELRNYARPNDFWDHGLNLYMDNFYAEGFRPLDCHPREYRPGDCFLMAVRSKVVNHAAVLLPDGQIAHHLYGSLSRVEPYRGVWRNTTMAVVRHRDVNLDDVLPHNDMDLMELLPDGVRRKLAEALSRRGEGESGVHPEDGGDR
jgi:cell wall-associated NlpC family hydrolase